jgi:predicted DNA-binding transcriptional regulator YafY
MPERNDDLTAPLSQLLPLEMEAIWLGALLTERFATGENAATARRIIAALQAIRARTIDGADVDLEVKAVDCETTAKRSLARHLDIQALKRALVHELKLKIEYIDAKGKGTKRTVWPLDVQDFGPNGAMFAHCEKRRDFRNFRFDRITELAIIQQRFEAPRSVMLAFNDAMQAALDGGSGEW